MEKITMADRKIQIIFFTVFFFILFFLVIARERKRRRGNLIITKIQDCFAYARDDSNFITFLII